MSTLKQKETAKITLENIGIKAPKTKGVILREVGYSEAITKNPKEVYETRGYKTAEKELLIENKIDKNSRLKRLSEIFWDKDKRSCLGANKEITLMLGEYADKTLKISSIDTMLDDLRA